MKKQYEKPQLSRVELVPEEAVLGGCKIAGNSTGPSGGFPTSDCLNNHVECLTIGS